MFTPNLNLNLLPQPTDTFNGYPSPVYQMLIVNWSAFLEGIVLTLQSHDSNYDTNGEHQSDNGNVKLLPLLTGHLCGLLM